MKWLSKSGALIAACALICAGCSSGGGGGTSPGSRTGDTSDAGSSPIRIGAIVPQTGGNAVYGPGNLFALQTAVSAVNAAGGVLGRKLKLYVEDDQSTASQDVIAAQKLLSVDKVSALIGVWGSSQALAVAPIAAKANVVLMANASAPEYFASGPLSLSFGPQEATYGERAADLAKKNGYSRIAILAVNNTAGKELAKAANAEAAKNGTTVTNLSYFTTGQSDYTAELGKALRSKPDAIVTYAYPADGVILLKEAESMVGAMHWIGPGFSFPSAQKVIDTQSKHQDVWIVNPVDQGQVSNGSDEVYDAFAKAYQAKVGTDIVNNAFASSNYDMVLSFALGAAKAGSTVGDKVVSALQSLSTPGATKVVSDIAQGLKLVKESSPLDFYGFTGEIRFNSDGAMPLPFGAYHIENGQLKLISVTPASY